MSSPQWSDSAVTPMEVARFQARLTDELGELVRRIGQADRAAVAARMAYIKARAVAFRQASGSVEGRKYIVDQVTIGYRIEAEEAACEVRDLNRQIDYMDVRIGVSRSLGTTVRAELEALGPWTEG